MNASQTLVQTKADVIARLQQQQTALWAPGVAQLGLFGSFVRDEAGPESDVLYSYQSTVPQFDIVEVRF